MLRKLARIIVRSAVCVAVSPLACGEIRILAVTSSAGFAVGLPSPGSLATVFCTGLTGIAGVVNATGSPLPRVLADVRVTFGQGSPVALDAPILAVADFGSYQQVNFQVPWDAGLHTGTVILSQLSKSPAGAEIPQASAPWGQFFTDSEGFAVAQHISGYRLVTRDDPARAGEWIVAYGTNFGDVFQPPPTGTAASLDHLSPLDSGGGFPWQYSVRLEGAGSVTYNFIGLTPGAVGVYQINFKMPDAAPPQDTQLSVTRSRNCGFFFVRGCGRGFQTDFSTAAKLHAR